MISCIITTYQRPIHILKRAIDSVVNQTYKDIELIVVNDAPAEKKLAEEIGRLIMQYPIRKQYIIHDVNKGACAARNTGIVHASGEYIAFLDDDDEWLPEKLARQYNLLQQESLAIVSCAYNQIGADGKLKVIEIQYPKDNISDFEKLLTYGNFLGSTSFPLIRTDVFLRVGNFDIELKSSQDYEMWIRIAEHFPVGFIDDALVNYYISDVCITKSMKNREQGFWYIIDKYKEFYCRNRKAYNCRLNRTAVSFLRDRAIGLFFKYWIKAVVVWPFSRYNLEVFYRIYKKIQNR